MKKLGSGYGMDKIPVKDELNGGKSVNIANSDFKKEDLRI
jgi:hypothetical protein|tara:strand:- start:199 stop:318 length:120 start_codon:yes stop_codon:yes gene_type:complete